jgi:hypothetical protein
MSILRWIKNSAESRSRALSLGGETRKPRGPFLSLICCAITAAVCSLVTPLANAQTFGCSPAKANDIVCENSKPGNPSSEWDISTGDAGDPTIQGFATDISVNQGGTIFFKINTPAKAYTINIYRIGYYGGNGARFIASVTPSVTLPQTQPACLSDSTTHLLDCGSWAVSASWQVPANATSGVYIAHLIRNDTGGDSHIVFIVRNDSSHSAIFYQTADESWQAYNPYGPGGYSVYGDQNQFDLPNRAFKVSYNRPFATRGFEFEAATWLFGAEASMIQWMEQNGYDVTYTTGLDAARNGSLIKNHRLYVTAGHDEYWSGPQRINVKAARDAGVNLAFFSGNEMFWKVRWENSIDGTNTPYRTMVCYKETLAFAQIDPDDPPTWTGTWRDPSFSPPADGGLPENNLTGTLFMVNGVGSDNDGTLAIQVPAADGKMRFWRNTAVASQSSGQVYTLPAQTLGYESDEDIDNGFRPAGAFQLSTTPETLTSDLLLDFGATYGAGSATHHMMMYRAPSGALVFGAGTVDFAWGLNSNHDDPFGEPQNTDPNEQQAVVNLFADMGVQPATLQSGLVPATASTDTTPPTSAITSPTAGSILQVGSAVTVTGTATDAGGGIVAGVEVSVDGGTTWHPASGRGSWSYTGTPTVVGNISIMSRAVDDSGNLETPSSGVAVTVAEHDCPCDVWNSSSSPQQPDSGDSNSVEVGVKFRADYNGYVTGIRFYKSSANTGAHIGNLWSASGQLLASATFTNETGSGWQQVLFSNPVAITANTVYVASYFAPNGHYAATPEFFATSGLDNPPVHLLANDANGAGPDGVYSYSTHSTFPTATFNSTNYWVDVVYLPGGSMPDAPSALIATPASLSFVAFAGQSSPPSQSITVYNQGTAALAWTAASSASWLKVSPTSGTLPQTISVSVNQSGLSAGTYSGTITVSAPGAANSPQTVSVSLQVTNLLMSDNFATQGLQGWVVSPLGLASDWSIVNQALQFSGGGNSQVFAGNSAWTDYTLSVPFKLTNLQDYPGGIRGRINPSTGAGYMVWVYPALGEVILYKATQWNINSGLTQLAVGNAAFDATNFHNLSLSFLGSQIQVLYDGNTIITATDTTYTSGLIALEGLNQVINFGNVVVTSSDSTNTGTITVGSTSLSFGAVYQGPSPSPQNDSLTTGGGGVLAWTAVSDSPWLSVSPSVGTGPATLQVAANSSSLSGGTYNGTITVLSFGASNLTQVINVTLTVTVPPPSIVPSPGSLSFTADQGQPAPPAQVISVLNGGLGSFSYSVSSDSSWLSGSPASGSTPGSVSVSVNSNGLSTGSYTGHITITASGISNSPLSIPVSLEVLSSDMTETFSDVGAGWIISPMGNANGWSVSSGVYSYSGIGLSQSCSGNSAWTDYTFDTNIKLSSSSNWPGGVRARVNPSTGAGYVVWLYPGSNLMILYKLAVWNVNDSSLTQLAQAAMTFDTNPHDLTVDFHGSQVSVLWDGKPMMSATDSTYASGFVCLDADNQPISYSDVRVSAVQSQAALSVTPSSLVFSALPGSTPTPQTVTISAGGAATAWAVTSNQSWLTAAVSSTLTPATITVSVSTTGFGEGSYSGTLTVSAPGASGSPFTIPVILAVKTAVMSVTPTTSLVFFGATTANPASQSIQITNSGTGTLGWTASDTSTWLGLSPTSGSAPSAITVSPNSTILSTGSYTDTVTISSPDVTNSPAQVPVSLQVGNLLFSDNFSSGAGNWTIGPLGNASDWSVSSGVYSYNGSGETESYAGDSTWTDYTVSADFKLSSLNDYPGGLRGRLNTSTGASYGVWIYPAEGILKLYKIGQWNIDASFSLLGQSPQLTMDTTNFHHLRICFQGATILVYYDNVLQITATDSTYTQGAIAFDVSNQPISFTNVSVISLP